MIPAEKMLLIMAVVLNAFSLVEPYYDVETKIDELDKKVTGLEDSMKKVSEEIGKIYKFTNKVEKAFYAVNGVNMSQGYTSSNQELPISIHEIRREPLGEDEVRYVVRYTKNSNGIDYAAVVSPYTWKKPIVTIIEGNVEEASMTVKKDKKQRNVFFSSDSAYFVFYNDAVESGLLVGLGTPYEESLRDQNVVLSGDEIKFPGVDINPPKDIVYEEGNDVKVTVTLASDKNKPANQDDLRTQAYLYDLENEEFMSPMRDLSNYTIFGEPKNVTGGIQFDITFKTSEKRVSGLIEFSRDNRTQISILGSVGVLKMIDLRPSTQPKPFPENTISFLSDFGIDYYGEENNTEIYVCGMELDDCNAQCLAVGENLFGVIVMREMPDGSKYPVQKRNRWGANYPYLKAIDFSIQRPPKLIMGESQLFTCTATGFHGETATKYIRVKFVMRTHILENSTSAQLTQNGTLNTISLECIATGKPLPNITFDLRFEYADRDLNVAADKTSISEDGTHITGTKTVTYDTDLGYGEGKGRLYSAYCKASGLAGIRHEDIPLPV